MRYFKDAETGQVFAYEDDDLSAVLPHLVPLTQDEIDALLDKKQRDERAGREAAWVAAEMTIVAEQLLMHDDDDDMAVSIPEAWKEYRKALRRWIEGAEFFPDQDHRPVSPA
ncbi:TPA: hypothetical protein SMQ04_000174 [Pseudomonas putida]|nr:hypothetical protein [Pseudomonas putida]